MAVGGVGKGGGVVVACRCCDGLSTHLVARARKPECLSTQSNETIFKFQPWAKLAKTTI